MVTNIKSKLIQIKDADDFITLLLRDGIKIQKTLIKEIGDDFITVQGEDSIMQFVVPFNSINYIGASAPAKEYIKTDNSVKSVQSLDKLVGMAINPADIDRGNLDPNNFKY